MGAQILCNGIEYSHAKSIINFSLVTSSLASIIDTVTDPFPFQKLRNLGHLYKKKHPLIKNMFVYDSAIITFTWHQNCSMIYPYWIVPTTCQVLGWALSILMTPLPIFEIELNRKKRVFWQGNLQWLAVKFNRYDGVKLIFSLWR